MQTLMAIFAVLAVSVGVSVIAAKEGDTCFHRKLKRDGVCRELHACPGAQAGAQQCPYRRGDSATVCCAAPTATDAAAPGAATNSTRPCYRLLEQAEDTSPPKGGPPGTVATAMCRRYARLTCERRRVAFPFDELTVVDHCESHNRTDQLIVGGREARAKEYPHMALLGYGDKPNIQYLCGGSLVSPNFVLTAAHCVISGGSGEVRWVLLGTRDRSAQQQQGEQDQQQHQDRPQLLAVAQRLRHPEYDPPVKYHDIALLRLAQDARFDEGFVRPACLGVEPRVEERRRTATATGWGLTDWDGEPSSRLMTVTLNLTSLAACQEAYGRALTGRTGTGRTGRASIPRGILDSQLCAGAPGKDSCEGDSGGPLQLFPSSPYCMFHVVGVVSFGQFCGFNTPGVYARVAHYLPWIEKTVWPPAPQVSYRTR